MIKIRILQFIIFCSVFIFSALASESSKEEENNKVVDKSRMLQSTILDGKVSIVGGTELIGKMLSRVVEANERSLSGNILEIACNYGGVANFIKLQNHDKVFGIDIDEAAINYAKDHYPGIDFQVADAIKLNDIFKEDFFNFIYMFDTAHSISDKLSLFQRMKSISKQEAIFVIIDYATRDSDEDEISDDQGNTITPINLKKLEPLMKYIGLDVLETIDITSEYKTWYNQTLDYIAQSRDDLLKNGYSEDDLKLIIDKYTYLLNFMKQGKIGGLMLIIRRT